MFVLQLRHVHLGYAFLRRHPRRHELGFDPTFDRFQMVGKARSRSPAFSAVAGPEISKTPLRSPYVNNRVAGLTRLAFDDLRLSQTSACAYDLSREALGQGRPMIANWPLQVDPTA
jgi:hypothetical protein